MYVCITFARARAYGIYASVVVASIAFISTVLFLSYLYPNVINIIVLLLQLQLIVLPEIYELDYKHAIVTALLISFDACYAPSAPAGSVFVRDVLVDKLRGYYIQGVIRTHNVPTILW